LLPLYAPRACSRSLGFPPISGLQAGPLECGSLLPLSPRELARGLLAFRQIPASKLACSKAAASRRTPKQRAVARIIKNQRSPSPLAALWTPRIFTSSGTAETTTRAMELHYLRTPTGRLIKDYGRLRTTTELSLPLDILQKQDRTRIIYLQAIKADDFICRKKGLFGQIQFTSLGTARRDLRQHESLHPTLRVVLPEYRCGGTDSASNSIQTPNSCRAWSKAHPN